MTVRLAGYVPGDDSLHYPDVTPTRRAAGLTPDLTLLSNLLLLPPGGPLLLLLAGLLWPRRRPAAGRRLAWGGLALLYLCSAPLTANLLSLAAQPHPPLAAGAGAGAGAVAVLAGGLYRGAPEYGGDEVGLLSLGRARYAARLARERRLPVLASGGVGYGPLDRAAGGGRRSEARLLAGLLRDEFGVTAVWTEDSSHNTWENARNSARRLRARGIGHVLLVTHAVHMPRAVAAFEWHGLRVTPAPTLYLPTRLVWNSAAAWAPRAASLAQTRYVLYELAGRIWYRLRAFSAFRSRPRAASASVSRTHASSPDSGR